MAQDRNAYTTCMVPYMKGGGPERKTNFCIGAKLCSGKARDKEEAERLCAEAALNPKPAKPRGSKKQSLNLMAVSTCIIEGMAGLPVTQAKLVPILAKCVGQKSEPVGREAFIKKCFKDNAVTGDMKESQKLRSMCSLLYKSQQEAPIEAR